MRKAVVILFGVLASATFGGVSAGAKQSAQQSPGDLSATIDQLAAENLRRRRPKP